MTIQTLQLVTSRQPFFENQLKALEQRGVKYDVVRVPSPSESTRGFREYLRFYGRVLSRVSTKYDIVHANYGLTGPFALAQPKRPTVMTYWGSDLMGEFDWLSKAIAGFFDSVVLPSAAMAELCPVDHVRIPFGIPTDLFSPIDKRQARRELGWEQDSDIVLFPYSKQNEVKNYPLARTVIESVSGPVRLETISNVPHDRMPIYMNASDAVLVTSKRESGPQVVKEAALCNVPVVSTNVGFVEKAVGPIENCFVADQTSELVTALERVLNGDAGAGGQELADQWGVDRMGEELVSLYNRVLDQKVQSNFSEVRSGDAD